MNDISSSLIRERWPVKKVQIYHIFDFIRKSRPIYLAALAVWIEAVLNTFLSSNKENTSMHTNTKRFCFQKDFEKVGTVFSSAFSGGPLVRCKFGWRVLSKVDSEKIVVETRYGLCLSMKILLCRSPLIAWKLLFVLQSIHEIQAIYEWARHIHVNNERSIVHVWCTWCATSTQEKKVLTEWSTRTILLHGMWRLFRVGIKKDKGPHGYTTRERALFVSTI